MDIAAFLSARYDEDQQLAEDATDGPWVAIPGGKFAASEVGIVGRRDGRVIGGEDGGVYADEDAVFIAAHDPHRALADIAAKRVILRQIDRVNDISLDGVWTLAEPIEAMLKALAAPYAEHQDFDPAWAVGD